MIESPYTAAQDKSLEYLGRRHGALVITREGTEDLHIKVMGQQRGFIMAVDGRCVSTYR